MAEVTKFSWEPESADYYRSRIKSLEDQLSNAQKMCELKASYINDLEKKNFELTQYVDHLKEKLLEEVLR